MRSFTHCSLLHGFLSLFNASLCFFKQIDSVSEEVDRQRSICDMVSSLKHMSIKAKDRFCLGKV